MRPIVLRAKEKNVFKSNKNHDDVALQPSLDTDQKPHLYTTQKEELVICMPARSMLPPRQWFGFLWWYISKALARSVFVFLNGHYLDVIRYCQSVREKQRVLKKSLGNKSLQLKSHACVCDCHLLSLPWEKVMRLSSFAAVWAQRVHF